MVAEPRAVDAPEEEEGGRLERFFASAVEGVGFRGSLDAECAAACCCLKMAAAATAAEAGRLFVAGVFTAPGVAVLVTGAPGVRRPLLLMLVAAALDDLTGVESAAAAAEAGMDASAPAGAVVANTGSVTMASCCVLLWMDKLRRWRDPGEAAASMASMLKAGSGSSRELRGSTGCEEPSAAETRGVEEDAAAALGADVADAATVAPPFSAPSPGA